MRTRINPRFNQPAKKLCCSMADVGSAMRLRRKELGYSQTDIAEFAGCSQRLISEIERGKSTVAFGTVLRILNGLGIDMTLQIRGKR